MAFFHSPRLLFPFLLLAAACCFPAETSAQITDDFSDGDFSQNPAWQGDAANFIVNAAGELQLNAPDAGTSVLAVMGNIPDSAVWNLKVRLEFAPSASNLLRIYLLANDADLLNANGYFLEIGENGTADALRFYRQEPGLEVLLATGLSGQVATDPTDIRLRVKRSKTGNWTVDLASGTGPFQPQFSVSDATFSAGPAWFGVYCLYTATRKDKFFFDDLSILADLPDVVPPVLLSASAASATEVVAVFDESLDSASAVNPAHYSISGIGQPQSVSRAADLHTVHLFLPGALPTGSYTLQTDQVADTSGNISGAQTAGFQFLSISAAAAFDVLINEIMSDPTPSQGLPEVEWIELFNRSDKYIDLSTLLLSDGGSPSLLPAYVLAPDSFVVLCSTGSAAALSAVAPHVLGMPGFPSLNNDGDPLSLTDVNGAQIDAVHYLLGWHTDSDKADGGWTLERINPFLVNLPCVGAENWQSCPVFPGGTPGKVNASLNTTPDVSAPALTGAFALDASTIRLQFSESLDPFTAADPGAYLLQPSRAIATATPSPDNKAEVLLTLSEPLQLGVLYAVFAQNSLQDCSGNALEAGVDTAFVVLPDKPSPGDIVLNEILFNPASGGKRYVEFLNRSDKIFSLQDFYVADYSEASPDIAVVAIDRLFLPGQLIALTTDRDDILARFHNIIPENLLESDLPTFDDTEGNATLYWEKNGERIVVDSFDYSEEYHNALLSDSEREGVALERIDPNGPTNVGWNWTSASPVATGSAGTPTLPNSQRSAGAAASDDLIRIPLARISPDGDGREDFLEIQYKVPEPGYSGEFTIYDSEGIVLKHILRQQLLGTSGILHWDGDTDEVSKARPGIHILFAEMFSPTGEVKRVKKVFAVVE